MVINEIAAAIVMERIAMGWGVRPAEREGLGAIEPDGNACARSA
jgi:hypothetical protein